MSTDKISPEAAEKFILAARRNDLKELTQFLEAHGPEIMGKKDKLGWSALSWAAWKGHMDTIDMLLDHGADINILDDEGRTPLMRATTEGRKEVAMLLAKRGADVNIADREGWTALMLAAMGGQKGIVQLLLRYNARLDKKEGVGWTAAKIAELWEQPEIKEILEERAKKQAPKVNIRPDRFPKL